MALNKRIMFEEVLAEFEKVRQGRGRGLYLVRLSKEAMEYFENILKSELRGIEYAEFLKSLPTLPYQPHSEKGQ